EAMGHGVPVVAYASTAVPETVGDAGLLLATKEPLRFATTVHRVVADEVLRRRLSRAASRRAAAFALDSSAARFVALVRDATSA
ncbi:MAG: glycosyltransferase family 4 protein, partial [Acidimicrobiales bacterium]